MKKEWDEKNYSENFSFVHEYGERYLNLSLFRKKVMLSISVAVTAR